ncbi:MAG: DUF2834 domain-containing protein [Acidobacteria bacterium]|nr:DUF2834 domain-containing protein [Acidobacteriota bacterium]
MRSREAVYTLLALAGLIAPWYFNIRYAAQGGSLLDLGGAIRLAFANPVSSSLSVDVLIAFAVFIVWVLPEARRIGMRAGWIYPVLGFLIAFAFAFPLFLLMRERHLRLEGADRAV